MGYGGCTGPNTLRFCGAAHCSTIHSHEGDYPPVRWCLGLWLMYYGQVLKTHTREVLYEKFRTEKLLARRATRKIGEEQTKKLLQGVFSPPSSHPLLSTNSTLRSRVVIFHSDWFRISSRSNLDTVTTSAYLCMLTYFLRLIPSSLVLGSFSLPLVYLA
jgi:hypothetical protein